MQVREGSPLRQVSIYSPSFPAPVSTNECQVSLLGTYSVFSHKELSLLLLICPPVFVQMHFSLYLYGDFNGTLVVAIEENGTANSPLVWKRNGQGSDDWDDVALQLTGIFHRYKKERQRNKTTQINIF